MKKTDKYELGTQVEKNELKLIGIKGRTNNEVEMQGQGIIPRFWDRFYSEQIIGKIPNKSGNGTVIAVYCEFESDDSGPYSFFIGVEVDSFADIPEGMESLLIPKSKYLEISTQRGKLQEVGIQAWQKIWQNQPIRENRSFIADLEVYSADAQNPENARFDIYLGMK
ncbi:MAG: GyrI-like domain-containing protein [Bacteroidales bacterium]|nr:GyrI-like domain-containing protein [Bacteroidales bacterium]